MKGVQPWMRLKTKTDTFFLPGADGAVYFRNNEGSFRMEGTAIASWIEKLLPVFDGQQTMASLTDGLPTPYRDRIYEIAGILHDNGYLRDVSGDAAYSLPDQVLAHYAPQIEFVDNAVGSGASRFETYRKSKVLIVGGGDMLISLARSLFESGLSSVHMVVTDGSAEITASLRDALTQFDQLDEAVAVDDWTERARDTEAFLDVLRTMDAVLYVSSDVDLDELRRIESICRGAHVSLSTAVGIDRLGIVVSGTSAGDSPDMIPTFDAVWRRIHRTVLDRDLHISGFSETSAAILANVLVFERFKSITGVDSSPGHRVYTLNAETLEGQWHDVIPAPDLPIPDVAAIQPIKQIHERLTDESQRDLPERLAYFSRITDQTTGMFHVWDEGSLLQLPLAQCRVRPIDPLSVGPANLLAEILCTGMTHEDARCEAGLAGIEAYVRRLVSQGEQGGRVMGIGAGWTTAEALGRGLHDGLARAFQRTVRIGPITIRSVRLREVRDENCAFYLRSLRAVDAEMVVGHGENVFGFPVVWVGANGRFVGSVGFCESMALQHALAYALRCESQGVDSVTLSDHRCAIATEIDVEGSDADSVIDVDPWPGMNAEQVTAALTRIERLGEKITVLDLALEPFLKEPLAGVMGVSIGQGEWG